MFLVMLHHLQDDLPLAIFNSREVAEQFAAEADWDLSDELRKMYRSDCSTPCSFSIIEFQRGAEPPYAQLPVNKTWVRRYDEEEAPIV